MTERTLTGLETQTGAVVGAVSGIGRAVAERLSGLTRRVVLVDRDEAVNAVASELGASAIVHDVSEDGAGEAISEAIRQAVGVPNFLVYCAGVQRRGTLLQLSEQEWRELEGVNATGARRLLTSVAGLMVSEGISGSMVTVTSSSARTVTNGIIPYSVTKAALEQFTRGLAAELGRHGIRVNAVAPGYIRTAMTREVLEDRRFLERLIPRIPMGYVADPEEVAGPVAFLLSDEARYVTGAVLPVDGGFTLGALTDV